MMAWAVRRQSYVARLALLTILFPLHFLPMLLRAIRVGTVYHFDFWDFHYRVFWAAVEGAFVGMPIKETA